MQVRTLYHIKFNLQQLLAFIVSALFASSVVAQDTVTIKHERYSTTFDTVLKYPVLVHWVVTAADLCDKNDAERVERTSASFKPEPQLKKYTNLQIYYTKNPGSYQRGHNMNAADNSCDLQQMKECFYFSNITPQTKELNEDTWGNLEDDTRKLVKLYGKVEVWCGSYAYKEKMGDVTVPLFCWKVLKFNGMTMAYIFPNHNLVNQKPYWFYAASLEAIRTNSKLKLLGL